MRGSFLRWRFTLRLVSTTTSLSPAVVFAVVFIARYVGHGIGDRWLQTDYQATTKGEPGWVGRWACLRHVLSYTAATAGMTVIAWVALDLPVTVTGLVVGEMVSAVTHYWADRRFTLCWVVDHLLPWKATYYYRVSGGAEHLDQTFHWFWLFVGTLLTALIR